MRSKTPSFFYEFKRHRTLYTKEKVPEKKEHYHVTYMRERKKEQQELEKKKKKEEERQKMIHEAEIDAFRKATGSHTHSAAGTGTGRTETDVPVDISLSHRRKCSAPDVKFPIAPQTQVSVAQSRSRILQLHSDHSGEQVDDYFEMQ